MRLLNEDGHGGWKSWEKLEEKEKNGRKCDGRGKV